MKNLVEAILNKRTNIGGKQDRLSLYLDKLYIPYFTISDTKLIVDVDALNKAGFTQLYDLNIAGIVDDIGCTEIQFIGNREYFLSLYTEHSRIENFVHINNLSKSELRLGHISYLKGKVDNMYIRPLPGNAPTIKFKWDKVTGGIKYVNSKDDGLGQNFFLDKQTIYNRPINLEFEVPPRHQLNDTRLKQLLEDNKLAQKIPYERLFYFINNLGERGFLIKTKKSNFNPSQWNMELIDESGILYSKPNKYGEFYYQITKS